MPSVNRIRKSIASRTGKAASRLLRIKYGSCAVLLYHRVATLETDPQELSVTPENFESHLELLKKEFHLLKVSEFKEHIKNAKRFPEKSVLITFDDGYADNFLYALPILEKENAEALFYICTGNLDTPNEFWWDELERLLLCSKPFPKTVSLRIGTQMYACTSELNSRQSMYNQLLPVLRQMNFTDRENYFQELRKLIPSVPRLTHRSLTSQELKRLSESNAVTIGAHTVHHCSLGYLTEEDQRVEITESISTVESIIGKTIEDFSYPFGTYRDFNRQTIEICKQSNMNWVAANIPGCVHAKSNPYSFPRFLVRNWNGEEFLKQVNSFFKK